MFHEMPKKHSLHALVTATALSSCVVLNESTFRSRTRIEDAVAGRDIETTSIHAGSGGSSRFHKNRSSAEVRRRGSPSGPALPDDRTALTVCLQQLRSFSHARTHIFTNGVEPSDHALREEPNELHRCAEDRASGVSAARSNGPSHAFMKSVLDGEAIRKGPCRSRALPIRLRMPDSSSLEARRNFNPWPIQGSTTNPDPGPAERLPGPGPLLRIHWRGHHDG